MLRHQLPQLAHFGEGDAADDKDNDGQLMSYQSQRQQFHMYQSQNTDHYSNDNKEDGMNEEEAYNDDSSDGDEDDDMHLMSF